MYEFREAIEADYENICDLIKGRNELFLVYPNGSYPFNVDQLTELSKTRIELTVVTEGNRVLGFANLYNHKPKEYAFIGNVIIDKSQRGKGIGKELVSYMLEKAYSKYDLQEVRISVFSENTRALLLYSGFGFVPYEIEERENYQGSRVALVHLKKLRI